MLDRVHDNAFGSRQADLSSLSGVLRRTGSCCAVGLRPTRRRGVGTQPPMMTPTGPKRRISGPVSSHPLRPRISPESGKRARPLGPASPTTRAPQRALGRQPGRTGSALVRCAKIAVARPRQTRPGSGTERTATRSVSTPGRQSRISERSAAHRRADTELLRWLRCPAVVATSLIRAPVQV